MQEKKALSSRGLGRLVGILELRLQCGVAHEVQAGVQHVQPDEEGMATQSSIFTWRIPWTEEPGGLQSIGSQESDQRRGTSP